ncbi:MAG: hypothetical protein M3011_03025 [Actinomycetota bacterium]|nr:hypothetical protein [Actinomycetota bacterium]
MPIVKGGTYGAAGPFPADGVVVRSDAEARRVVESARRERRPSPVLGLLGGDLHRTLGGSGSSNKRTGDAEARLRAEGGVTFPVDLGEVLIDGHLHLFVAHLVARSRLWTRAFVAMNAQWLGAWNLGPRAHPGDGLLDTYDAHLRLAQLLPVRSRLHHGAHLPHPGIKEQRTGAIQVDFGRDLAIEVDGEVIGKGRRLAVRVEPDNLTVVV